jgi:Zn-finger nucleic acid-binding protein
MEVFMFCPACKDSVLSMTERQGVEIDFCPKCRGVWLDRGELDKIIEKSAVTTEAPPPVQQNNNYQQPQQQHPQQPYYKGYKRRKSFLEELFD